MKITQSPWQRHVKNWKHCTRCPLWHGRNQTVLGKGVLPCDVLLIGEAPGADEDDVGEPFVGVSGKLLHQMMGDAGIDGKRLTYFITNTVACRPSDGHGRNEPPAMDDVVACMPRVKDVIRMARPRLVVLVGAVARAEKSSLGLDDDLTHCMFHPAFLLRNRQLIASEVSKLERALRRIKKGKAK